MEKEKIKRSFEEIQESSSESNNKRKRIINNDELLEKFNCTDFYIDKSLLIKEFLDESSKIICVTKPSKFGKTVNLTMMRYFFEMNYEDENNNENRELFEKLNIAKEINENGERYIDLYQGKFPVIYLDFNEIKIGSSLEETIEKFIHFIKDLYNNYKNINIESLNNYNKKMWKKYIKCKINNINDLVYSIGFLCEVLYELLNKQIILLIDNYDSLILDALNTGFFYNICSFHKQLFSYIFRKTKCYLFRSFITGKINVYFFNEYNSKNYAGLDNVYDKYYSMTDFELRQLLSELKLKKKK